MVRTIFFDLDDTLAQVGKQAENATVEKLKQLNGKIAVCSGKPVYYLCGFMRQLGIYDAVLIGEMFMRADSISDKFREIRGEL